MNNLSSAIYVLILATASFCHAGVFSKPPSTPDTAKTHLIYLHGAILTGTDGHAVSAEFGTYEYQTILQRLSKEGFDVISEVRRDDDVPKIARRVEGWISALKQAGVPSSRIAVVGASMGGIIAGRVSHQLKDRAISYVLIASLYQMSSFPPVPLNGRVLSIRDSADTRTWVEDEYLVESRLLTESKVVVTTTGRGHGLLYRPDDAWVLPTLEWLRRTPAGSP